MSPQTASLTLKITGYFSLAFALAIAAGSWPATFGIANSVFGLVGLSIETANTEARFLSGLLGGVFASWCVFLIAIVAPAIERGDDAVRRGAMLALVVWYVVDSSGSALSGVPINVAINTVFFVVIMAPLMLVKVGQRHAASNA